jgi:hypothetical protein
MKILDFIDNWAREDVPFKPLIPEALLNLNKKDEKQCKGRI